MLLTEAHKLFRETFGISLNPFLDGFLFALFKKPIINLEKFDAWLEKKFSEDYKTMSMTELLLKHYGETVNSQIEDLLGLDV